MASSMYYETLEDVAAPPSRTTPTTITMPPDSHQILALHVDVGAHTLRLGCPRRRLARNGGVEPYTLALGSSGRCLSYTLVFGSKRRR
jgi:hypothetical protein